MIQCPQCKEPITVARPRSLVVEGMQAVERATVRLLVPFAVVTVLGTVITGCWMHGFSTVYLILGPEDAEVLLGIDSHMSMNSNWGLSLPFIPLTLFVARTTMADNLCRSCQSSTLHPTLQGVTDLFGHQVWQ